ncbi:hypothetical protein COW36_19700 [bacterium (Candidatus Blackallbacteria) CG17_big_fil_post_rev_8_21_14_2_50_48_46]|uniref:Uncharacterized protein n=1 Tax=bacterium (Candidatus Blackallbacteria) CG17_big_fil_post_rev_8_21_14_2_50_48_46 TaxID=2014261 RepID=A0A2M7FZP6_9BACT|nr:MAG: hypothetical protein COW64_15595 [bacterium (Candidatus Blackallbacteria) CG18_big_fil_WC_8_21_14_2_50_49_26]PIW14878.1 MAG: hypothetical protein COW36_19700 [bacterium (Candidatus Blackallbacteria) CG17_big_fil_post_rev_8_21_14_2_50_48_46]PIW44445.1 MAG: hypothetical protein COW20_24275 [bacterium (Candidatus Blackallbacteria) CG13_big_fil_rev_8_21_14_2_50_49_14]
MRSFLILCLLVAYASIYQAPVWAQIQANESTPQVYHLNHSAPDLAAPDLYQTLTLHPVPNIMGKDPFNDFVMVSGGISHLIFYGTDITLLVMGNFTNPFQIVALWSALILPILPSIAYFLRGKYEKGFSHFLSTGFFALLPLVLGVLLMIPFMSLGYGALVFPTLGIMISGILYLINFIWGFLDGAFFATDADELKHAIQMAQTQPSGCSTSRDKITEQVVFDCRLQKEIMVF